MQPTHQAAAAEDCCVLATAGQRNIAADIACSSQGSSQSGSAGRSKPNTNHLPLPSCISAQCPAMALAGLAHSVMQSAHGKFKNQRADLLSVSRDFGSVPPRKSQLFDRLSQKVSNKPCLGDSKIPMMLSDACLPLSNSLQVCLHGWVPARLLYMSVTTAFCDDCSKGAARAAQSPWDPA